MHSLEQSLNASPAHQKVTNAIQPDSSLYAVSLDFVFMNFTIFPSVCFGTDL